MAGGKDMLEGRTFKDAPSFSRDVNISRYELVTRRYKESSDAPSRYNSLRHV